MNRLRAVAIAAVCAGLLARPPQAAALWDLDENETKRVDEIKSAMKGEVSRLMAKGLRRDADELTGYLAELDKMTIGKTSKLSCYGYAEVGYIYMGKNFFAVSIDGEDEETHRQRTLAQGALLLHELIHAKHQGYLEWDETIPYAVQYKYMTLFGVTREKVGGVWVDLEKNTDIAYRTTGNSFHLSPRFVELGAGGEQRFDLTWDDRDRPNTYWELQEKGFGALRTVKWENSGGQGQSNIYTAPMEAGIYHLVVSRVEDRTKTNADGTTQTVAVILPEQVAVIAVKEMELTVSPTTYLLSPEETKDFHAEVKFAPPGAGKNVVWSVVEPAAGGSITPNGVYTAPSTPGTYHIRASAPRDNERKAEAVVTVKEIEFSVTPPSVTIMISNKQNGRQGFIATSKDARMAEVHWSVDGGTIKEKASDSVDFTTPDRPGFYTLTATSIRNPQRKASARIEVKERPKDPPPKKQGTSQPFKRPAFDPGLFIKIPDELAALNPPLYMVPIEAANPNQNTGIPYPGKAEAFPQNLDSNDWSRLPITLFEVGAQQFAVSGARIYQDPATKNWKSDDPKSTYYDLRQIFFEAHVYVTDTPENAKIGYTWVAKTMGDRNPDPQGDVFATDGGETMNLVGIAGNYIYAFTYSDVAHNPKASTAGQRLLGIISAKVQKVAAKSP